MKDFLKAVEEIDNKREELIASIKEIKDPKRSNDPNDYQFFYRGQSTEYPNLKPSIYAQNLAEYEHEMVVEIQSSNPDEFADKPFMIDKLALMQHYGLPTRLLDVTTSPLVALFFACGNDELSDGKTISKSIHILAIPNKLVKPWNSDTVSILSNLANISKDKLDADVGYLKQLFQQRNINAGFNKGKEIYDDLIQAEKENNFGGFLVKLLAKNLVSSTEKERIASFMEQNSLMGSLVSAVRYEKPSFRHRVNLEDLKNKVLCVLPRSNNKRLIAQKGAFLLYGIQDFDKHKCANLDDEKYILKSKFDIELTNDMRNSYLDKLAGLGVDSASLFPDITDRAVFIKTKYKAKVNSKSKILALENKQKKALPQK